MNNTNRTTEAWKPVVGFEGIYDVSDLGNVYSRLTGVNLCPGTRGKYLGFSLRRDGRSHSRYIHHLVAEAFIGPRPTNLDTCHENGIRTDNRAMNLRYGTRHSNMRDSLTHGTHQSLGRVTCTKGHAMTPENTYRRKYKSADGGQKYRDRCKTCLRVKSRSDYELWKLRHSVA